MGAVGSIRKVTLDGITFNATADTDLSQILGKYTNEAIATSGGNMLKQTTRVEEVTGLELGTNAQELDLLKGLSERSKPFPMSYVTAAGDVYRAGGWIELEKRQTADGKTSVKLIPERTWELFAA